MAKSILVQQSDYEGQILGSYKNEDGDYEVSPVIIDNNGYIVMQDLIHHFVHKGIMMRVVYTFQAVANNASVRIHHKSGTTKYVHSQLEVESIGRWRFQTYGGTTYSNAGIIVNSFNRRSDSTYIPQVAFYHTPTVNVLGTLRIDEYFGSGTTASTRTTGSISDRIESVFAPNADALMVLTNLSGTSQDVTVSFDFYENGI